MLPDKTIRSENHWRMEEYKQRITTKQWTQLLLNGDDALIFQGRYRQLKAKKIGPGVVEIYKIPKENP